MGLSPGTRLGPYELGSPLGAGGMGEVYRATDTNLKRAVAIKVLPPFFAADADRLARFQREAEILASLNHPRIAQVYGLERDAAATALVMELVEGPTLAERLATGPLPVDEALDIAMQIVDALEAAHERGIVHRDLKPANLKLGSDGSVKVLDFGIAKALERPFATSGPQAHVLTTPAVTQLGMILGTAAYMSPEQARGKPIDKRADIWAFGCVLYEMLAGQPAFGGDDVTATVARVLEREVDLDALPAGVPDTVRQTLKACLQKDPKRRLRDIGDVRLALEGAFQNAQTPAPPSAVPARRRIAPVAAALVAGGIIAALGAWQLWPAPEPAGVTRFSMPLQALGSYPSVTISRDGTLLGYRTATSPLIHVRDLREFDARALPGTESDAQSPPCFSPDGAWIAYASSRTALRKMLITGGASLTLTSGLANVGSCDWGEDGYIYFSPEGGIARVPEAGGPAETLATPRAERDELAYSLPFVLPARGKVMFTALRAGPTATLNTVVLDVATRERVTVLETGGATAYVPSGPNDARGHLVYTSGGGVFAVPFDLDRLETGTARPIEMGVLVADVLSAPAVVSTTGTLVYLAGESTAGLSGLVSTLAWVSRDGVEEPLPESTHLHTAVKISADGARALVAILDTTALAFDLWSYDLLDGRLTKLTFGGTNYPGVWAPGGRRFIYMHSTATTSSSEIRSIATDNSGPPVTLMSFDDNAVPTSMARDGGVLLVERGAAEARDIWALALSENTAVGGAAEAVPRSFLATAFNERHARFSPDATLVAYTSNESGRDEVYVAPYPGPGPKTQVSRGGGAQPRWNPNGRELFYRSAANELMAVELETSPTFRALTPRALFVLPAQTQITVPGSSYDVAPDGSRFLVIKAVAPEEQPPIELRVVLNWAEELGGVP